jgi:hypothetical protein
LNANGSYIIEYSLSRPGMVEVDILTIMGQKITSLVNEYQNEGMHESIFVNQTIGLSGAMYIYRIKSGKSIVSGKFVVIN